MPSGSGYQFNAAVTFTNVVIMPPRPRRSSQPSTPSTTLHAVTTNLLGINMVYWDPDTGTTQTQQMVTAAGLDIYRFPGGSASDDLPLQRREQLLRRLRITSRTSSRPSLPTAERDWSRSTRFGSPRKRPPNWPTSTACPPIPRRSAAESSGTTRRPVADRQLGNGRILGQPPRGVAAATDDGLIFLRIDHPAAFTDIKYWEVGNEDYGSWEVDHHGTAAPAVRAPAPSMTLPPMPLSPRNSLCLPLTILDRSRAATMISTGIDSDDPTGF